MNLTPHFSVKEMACKHCGMCLMRDSFMQHLEAFRVAYNSPVAVTSGYRCPDYNATVGGAKGSRHIKGDAADLSTARLSQEQISAMHKLCQQFFVNAVIGPGFIHVDDGPKRQWSY